MGETEKTHRQTGRTAGEHAGRQTDRQSDGRTATQWNDPWVQQYGKDRDVWKQYTVG